MNAFEEQPLDELALVVLDTETTGLYPGLGHRVTEIGAVRFEKWRPVAQLSQLVQPGRKIEAKATEISGIADEDLLGQPSFADVAPALLDLLDGAVVVAHNAKFDAEFIGLELWLAGHSTVGEPALLNPWICTLRLARRHFYFGRNSLTHIARRLNVRIGRAHRAMNDVYMTAEVLKRMSRELHRRGLHTAGDYLHAQQGAIYTPAPPRITLPQPIGAAVAAGSQLEILYVDRADAPSKRIITPRYATAHAGNHYLIAYCHLRQEQRAFRVDRIFSAAVHPIR